MSIKQTMRTPIAQDPNMVKAIVNEANDGLKATPAELVIKAMDDSTFTQVNENNPLPVKMSGDVELNVDPSNPLPVTGAVQLTGSNVAIANGVLSATNPSVEVNPIDDVKNVMIALNPHGFFENMNYQMVFEHYVPGLGWMPWHGGDGTPVELLYSTESPAVFGPYQGFPAFDKGRIRILGAGGGGSVTYNAFKNGTYSSSVQGNRLPEAFDEDIETNFSISNGAPTRSNPIYVNVDVGFDVLPTLFTMYGRDGSSTVEEFELQGQDGGNWDVLIDDILLRNDTTQEWNITATKKYRNYRIVIKSTHASLDVRMHDVRLYAPAEGDIDVSVWAVR